MILKSKLHVSTQAELIHYYEQGLQYEGRKELAKSAVKTLDEAIILATKMESCEAPKATSSSLLMMSNNSKAKRIECFFCKKLGHRANECRKKKRMSGETFHQQHRSDPQYVSSQRNDRNRTGGYAPQHPRQTDANAYATPHEFRNSGASKPQQLRMMRTRILKEVPITMSKDAIDLLTVDVQLNGHKCRAYLDCGVTTSTLSTRAAKQLGVKVNDLHLEVKYFNGSTDTTKGVVKQVCVELSSVVVNINFLVIDSYDFDVILGLNWFIETGASICPALKTLSFPGLKMIINMEDDHEYEMDKLMLQDIDSSDEITGVDAEWTWEPNKNLSVEPEMMLSKSEMIRFDNLKHQVTRISASCYAELGTCQVRKHNIHMSNHVPFFLASYRFPECERDMLWTELSELLKFKIIRRSTSPYGSRSFFVRKKGGTKRLVVDFKPLNAYMYQMHWPMPRIQDIFDRMSGAHVFSKLDSFWDILGDLSFVQVYIDDIIIYSITNQDHFSHLETVLSRLEQYEMKLNLAKCKFFASRVELLGHVVSSDGISTDPDLISAVATRAEPNNIKALQSFLG